MKRSSITRIGLYLMLACSVVATNATAEAPPAVQNPLPPGLKNAPPPRPLLPPPPFMAQQPPAIEKVSPGVFRIGDILINKMERSISFPAVVNMGKGLLEYLLVRNAGKTHESLLRTTVEPYPLQVAFLLLGYEGTDKPLAYQGDPSTPKGDSVRILVTRFGADGKAAADDYERWICKKIDKKTCEISTLSWIYTGSVVGNGKFLAQMEGSIIALYHDPIALIDNASAGGESDKIWFVKEDTVPPVGSAVTVTILPKH